MFYKEQYEQTCCIGSLKEKKPIKCDICDYGCYQSDMKLHVVSVHERYKQFKCKI